MKNHRIRERGAVAAQAAAMTSLLAVVMLLVLFTGRLVAANSSVQAAAHEAARAASLTGSATDAEAAAWATAEANLNTGGRTCRTLTVTGELLQAHAGGWVSVPDFEPGVWVSVTVTCTADFSDMVLLGVPGSRSFTATAIEVVDTYRGG